MKTRRILTFFITVVLLTGCRNGRIEDYVTFVRVDPLEKIFRETSCFSEVYAPAEVAIGECATFQFALRSAIPLKKIKIRVDEPKNGKIKLPVERTGLVKYVHISRATPLPAKDRLTSVSGFYPDPVVDASVFNMSPGDTQPIWITIRVPAGTPPGKYSGSIKIIARVSGKKVTFKKVITVTVYDVDLTSTSLLVTNWFSIDRLMQCNDNKSVVPENKSYWDLARMTALTMASYRINVALIDPLALTRASHNGSSWSFNFSYFNRMARLLINDGAMKRLEGSHLAVRESDWNSSFVMRVPAEGDSIAELPVTDERVRDFYSAFLPALERNLKENGWDSIYMQHIADEPTDMNAGSYMEISSFVHSLWPEVKIIDACHSINLSGSIDVWVPQMNFLEQDIDFYKSRQEKGDEVWYYTCMEPQGEYANRFIEQPLIKTRLLHWVNYRYGITGYLHWGFNFWNKSPWYETTGINTESGNILPGGDSWIVYPAYNRLVPSIRLEDMRDGIADYELLKKYHERYPEQADELVRQTVYGFRKYDTDINSFRNRRHKMLTALSSGQ